MAGKGLAMAAARYVPGMVGLAQPSAASLVAGSGLLAYLDQPGAKEEIQKIQE